MARTTKTKNEIVSQGWRGEPLGAKYWEWVPLEVIEDLSSDQLVRAIRYETERLVKRATTVLLHGFDLAGLRRLQDNLEKRVGPYQASPCSECGTPMMLVTLPSKEEQEHLGSYTFERCPKCGMEEH